MRKIEEQLVDEGQRIRGHWNGTESSTLDTAIRVGLEKGKDTERRRRRSRSRLIVMSGTAICLLLLLAISVRVSPVFANTLRQIPGLGAFVAMVEQDPGLSAAIDNDLMQPIGTTVKSGHMAMTVDGVLIDEQRLIVLYTVMDDRREDVGDISNIQITDQAGRRLLPSIQFLEKQERRDSHMMADISLEESANPPTSLTMEMKMNGEQLKATFPIDTSRIAGMARSVEIGQTVDIGGQKILLKRARISPLTLSVEVSYDHANTKYINGFLNVVIADEKGREWRSTGANGISTEGAVYTFQSNYFERPEKLILKGTGIYASDKKAKMVVDVVQKKIIEAPDSLIGLSSVERKKDYQLVTFSFLGLPAVERNRNTTYVPGSYMDGAGVKHSLLITGSEQMRAMRDNRMVQEFIPIPLGDLPQPLTFEFTNYPGHIQQHFEIDLGL
ncbi:DUF4179 domain-containing protein [Paenibacillus aurantiacus]|uniref:DUF4179 domain-containing protein n=1 Tax=Paenibacillus aurantiacus TaxID=1936118 RepID=A0ABV5KK21_9BACL